MHIMETNYGNFGNFRDILKFMTLEKIDKIVLKKASYCCSTYIDAEAECTREEIEKIVKEL